MDTTKTSNPHENDVTDLNNKMTLVFKVLQTCVKEKNTHKSNIKTTLDRLVLFTDLPKHVLCEVWDSLKIPEPLEPTNKLSYKMLEDPKTDFAIRQALITHYVKHNNIPTLKSFETTFPNASHCQIRQNLKRSGYIWKQVPNTKRAIIVERPERAIQRQRYLQQMDYYRKQKRSIVYVEEKIIHKSLPEYEYFVSNAGNSQNSYVLFIVVATQTGYIDGNFRQGTLVSKCHELFEKSFTKHILPNLPQSSVIVLEDRLNPCADLPIPTFESKKSSMINWLNINNIPHDENMHRVELLELIENCKDKRDLYKCDAKIYGRGHEILRRPRNTDYLNYFSSLWKDIFKSAEKTFRHDMITSKPPSYFFDLEKSLVAYEKVVYKEDLKMENVIDKVLTIAKYDTHIADIKILADSECDEEEDTLKQEQYLIHHDYYINLL